MLMPPVIRYGYFLESPNENEPSLGEMWDQERGVQTKGFDKGTRDTPGFPDRLLDFPLVIKHSQIVKFI